MWSRLRRLGLETVSRLTNVSSRSRLGSLDIASRRDVLCLPARAVHTVAAGRAILISMTFCGLDIFVSSVFTLSFTYLS